MPPRFAIVTAIRALSEPDPSTDETAESMNYEDPTQVARFQGDKAPSAIGRL